MRKNINVLSLALFILSSPRPVALSQPVWQQTSLDSGRVYNFATNSQGDIFVDDHSYAPENLYRSTNNGKDWTSLNIGYPGASVQCLLVDPQGRVFTSAVGVDSTQNGIYLSTDNGSTWQKRSPIWPHALITPDSGRTYLAASDDYYNYGVLRSVDTCGTWERISPPENGHSYSDVAITQQGSILAPRVVY